MRITYTNLAVRKGIGVELFKETDYFPKFQGTIVAVKDKFLNENRETVIRFLRAHQRALEFAREAQKGGIYLEEYKAINKQLKYVPEDVVFDLLQAYKQTDDIDINDLTIMQNHFVMTGSQKKFVPLDQVIDLSYLKEVKKSK
jgi:ABC-type nitrate/sulfonate/bicarbonate transport system substrate-binding protein